MRNIDTQKVLTDVIKRAESGEHTKIEWIRDYKTYRRCKLSLRAVKILISSLEYSAASLLNSYCKEITKGITNFNKLLIRKSLLQTITFYKQEFDILQDMIYEYDAYLMDGNYLMALLGEIRPISELWDRRDMDNGF